MIDLYRLLGIKRGATKEEVRKAYRRKAKVTHPDSGGSAEAFSALTTAHEVLSDARRREKYDTTGEIEPAKPNNFDGSAVEVIAQKLGLIIHAEHELTELDIGVLIEQAIREDIARRQASITEQSRAIERAAKLRARVRRKAQGADNMLARVLDWHERSAKDHIKKNEEAVSSMERALEILDGYAFIDDRPVEVETEDQVAAALRDTIATLDELAAILSAQPKEAAVG
ncbi:MAG: J domain-containing protein [Methyloceanibacter sp.]